MAKMKGSVTRAAQKQLLKNKKDAEAKLMNEVAGELAAEIPPALRRVRAELQRKKEEAARKSVSKGDENFWLKFHTQCTECGKKDERGRGYLFVGMTPEGEMKTFCNVICCDKWESVGDNKNSRRAAIKAQKAKKEQV